MHIVNIEKKITLARGTVKKKKFLKSNTFPPFSITRYSGWKNVESFVQIPVINLLGAYSTYAALHTLTRNKGLMVERNILLNVCILLGISPASD